MRREQVELLSNYETRIQPPVFSKPAYKPVFFSRSSSAQIAKETTLRGKLESLLLRCVHLSVIVRYNVTYTNFSRLTYNVSSRLFICRCDTIFRDAVFLSARIPLTSVLSTCLIWLHKQCELVLHNYTGLLHQNILMTYNERRKGEKSR